VVYFVRHAEGKWRREGEEHRGRKESHPFTCTQSRAILVVTLSLILLALDCRATSHKPRLSLSHAPRKPPHPPPLPHSTTQLCTTNLPTHLNSHPTQPHSSP
jgi:hypothetical protein